MGTPTGNTQPCPSCRSRGRDRRGDNLVSYDDGSAHCFACGYDEQPNKKAMVEEYDMIEFEGVARLPIKALDVRGIGVEWARLYGVRAEVSPETGEPVAFYYPLHRDPGMSLVGYQRKAAKAPGERQKGDVSRVGDTKGVLPFGAHVAKRGGSMVIVTEGAEDCLAAAQLLAEKGKRYRVVACLGVDGWKRNLEYYESFSKVAIAFDQDEAGQRAAQEMAEALSSGKAHIMRWKGPEDPNALVDHPNGADLFLDALNQAKPHNSAGIIYGEEVWERMQNFVEPKGVPYPEEWGILRAKVGDIREAEITMFTGGSSTGKTAYTRTIKTHLLLNTDARIGEVELEERGEKTWRGVMEVALGKPWATATKEERREAWEMTYGTNRIFTLDHRSQYGRGQSLIGKFKHLHYNMGCNVLFLDHVTLAVHEFGEGSGNQAQDQMMNEFLEFVETTGCHLFLVSHLRKSSGGNTSFEEGAVPSMDDLKGCTDADTEYLSPSGWRRIADYDGGLVAQWENGVLSYVTPEYIKLPSTEPFYHFRNANNLDMMLSGEHRMLLGGSVRTAKDVAHKPGRAVVPTTWHVGGEGIGLGVWDIRLRVMTAADGCYDGTRVKLELRKERKIRRAEEILMATGLPYRKRLTARGATVFTYPRPAWEKALHLSANWYSANTEELSILLDEVLRWDGCKHSRSGDYFATDKEGEADVVQWAAHACGRVARKRAYGKHYQVSVARPGSAKNQVVLRGDNLYVDRVVSSDGWKYCFTVPSSFFIARRNGRIFVTGNSGSLKQISFNIIGVSRNLQHEDDYERNVSQLHVLKCRETGKTGRADRLYWDDESRRLVPAMDPDEPDDNQDF